MNNSGSLHSIIPPGKFIDDEKVSPYLTVLSSGEAKKPGLELLRFPIKKDECVYARPNDILIIESCDHFVKLQLTVGSTLKKITHHSTLKEFLFQLPAESFLRINRFYAINKLRLTGINFNNQSIDFDGIFSIFFQRPISYKTFLKIGG